MRRSGFVFLVIAALLAGLPVAVAPGAYAQGKPTDDCPADWTPRVLGTYYGEASGGDRITVTFDQAAPGVLRGMYAAVVNGRGYGGTLVQVALEGCWVARLRWRDPFGVGLARLVFDKDGQGFAGTFGTDESFEGNTWNGRRVAADPKP